MIDDMARGAVHPPTSLSSRPRKTGRLTRREGRLPKRCLGTHRRLPIARRRLPNRCARLADANRLPQEKIWLSDRRVGLLANSWCTLPDGWRAFSDGRRTLSNTRSVYSRPRRRLADSGALSEPRDMRFSAVRVAMFAERASSGKVDDIAIAIWEFVWEWRIELVRLDIVRLRGGWGCCSFRNCLWCLGSDGRLSGRFPKRDPLAISESLPFVIPPEDGRLTNRCGFLSGFLSPSRNSHSEK